MTFNNTFDRVMSKFSDGRTFALATVSDGIPSARTVSGFSFMGKIYFQTDSLMDKAIEIQKNNMVAICADEVQIRGKCIECGHPFEKNNVWFANNFKKFFPKAYERYSHIETERVYEISPIFIKIWSKQEGIPALLYLDVEKAVCSTKLFKEY